MFTVKSFSRVQFESGADHVVLTKGISMNYDCGDCPWSDGCPSKKDCVTYGVTRGDGSDSFGFAEDSREQQ